MRSCTTSSVAWNADTSEALPGRRCPWSIPRHARDTKPRQVHPVRARLHQDAYADGGSLVSSVAACPERSSAIRTSNASQLPQPWFLNASFQVSVFGRKVFQEFDEDGSGELNTNEVQAVLEAVLPCQPLISVPGCSHCQKCCGLSGKAEVRLQVCRYMQHCS